MTFATPLWFGLLAVVVLRLVLAWRDRRRAEAAFRYSALSLVALPRSLRAASAWLPFALEIGAMILLTVALARPQEIERVVEDRRGVDIVIALDASGSMAAIDFQPRNRFEVAKELVGRFVDVRVDDRIGIVTFGQRAVTRVPVTFDRAVAQSVLREAEIGENGDGTAIGTAIATAVNRLRTSPARSRVIILLTDGINNAGSIQPAAAAEIARELGIRLYAVGVGSYGPVPVPIRIQDPLTGQIETIHQNIFADLDDDLLRRIAQLTGGEYFRATDERALAEVLATIDRLEKSRLAAPPDVVAKERYRPSLLAGFALLALALFTGETLWMRLPA